MPAKRILPALLLGGLALPVWCAAASFPFTSDNQGWVVVDYPFHSHVATPNTQSLPFDAGNGQPPGSVRVGDVFNETGIAAPASILGNQSAAYGDTLKYDILVRFSDLVDYPAVVLNAGTYSLYYDTPSPPIGSWQSRAIPLTEAGWKHSNTNAAATEAEFRAALAELAGIYLYTEWFTGPDDTNIDNIRWPGTTTGVDERIASDSFLLRGSWGRTGASLDLTLPAAGQVRLTLNDLAGREIAVLANHWETAGRHVFPIPGDLASGVYFARVTHAAPGATFQMRTAKLPILR